MYSKLCAMLAKTSLKFAATGLVAIIICVLYQVFGRYVLNDTPTWAEQLALLLVSYVTMLGTAAGVRDAGHIGLESFLVLAPEEIRRKLELVIHALVGAFGVSMVYYGSILAADQWQEMLPTLGVPDGLRYVSIAICGALIVLFSIEHLIAIVNKEEVVPAWH
ncbi:MAG: transporter small permease [Proteobacteria bacterium]|nr:transporter small permease [Pseudomonadota bacterium]